MGLPPTAPLRLFTSLVNSTSQFAARKEAISKVNGTTEQQCMVAALTHFWRFSVEASSTVMLLITV